MLSGDSHHKVCNSSCLPEELKQNLLSASNPQELEYRTKILGAIERNIQKNGHHTAQSHDSRARQFMPFAALKGYADMVQQEEGKH